MGCKDPAEKEAELEGNDMHMKALEDGIALISDCLMEQQADNDCQLELPTQQMNQRMRVFSCTPPLHSQE